MEDENELIALRRKKLEALRAKGIEPFGAGFDVSGSIAEVREQFKEGETFRVAGRITAHRDMGKSHFLDLRDATGRIQIYHPRERSWPGIVRSFSFAGHRRFHRSGGNMFSHQKRGTNSKSPQRSSYSPRHCGRSRKNGMDCRTSKRVTDSVILIFSRTSVPRAVFEKRIAIVRETRRFFEERGFVEVETPILQTIAGGAAAEPFKTRHKALGIDLYLRIALELYLKRLLVGGFNKVFEINRNFRNEGISRKHNPEFTMLEAYWAYADFEKVANLVEELICYLAEKICGSLTIEHRDADGNVIRTINLKRPWRRVRYRDLVREVAGKDWFELSPEQRRQRAMNEFKLEILPQLADFEVTQHVFEKLIEDKTIDPLFVTHCPKELVPLAKQNVEDSFARRCF